MRLDLGGTRPGGITVAAQDTRSGSDGSYVFPNLLPGTYTVGMQVPGGLTATTPRTIGGIKITSGQGSPNNNFGLNSGGAGIAGVPRPDIRINKSGPATAERGSTFTYTIAVRNRSKFTAHNVVVTDLLPVSLTLAQDVTSGTVRLVQRRHHLDASATWRPGALRVAARAGPGEPDRHGHHPEHGHRDGRRPAAQARFHHHARAGPEAGHPRRRRDGLMGSAFEAGDPLGRRRGRRVRDRRGHRRRGEPGGAAWRAVPPPPRPGPRACSCRCTPGRRRRTAPSKTGKLSAQAPYNGGPQVLLVLNASRDSRGRVWYRVRLPSRPNDAAGWIPAEAVQVKRTPYRITVSLGARRAELLRKGRVIDRWTVAVGTSANPTPTGRFAISEIVKQAKPNGFFGPYILTLTAHSLHLSDFDGGDGRVALHGTSLPNLLGQAVSHGCVRFPNSAAITLARTVPAGTPVDILS